jgi:hypothetical protein
MARKRGFLVEIQGVKSYRSKGRWYHYDRVTGQRLLAEPGTPEFLAEIQALRSVAREMALPRGTLASGTHRHWDFPLDNGSTAPLAFHAYPRSSGRVLRVIGKAIEEACEMVTGRDLQALRDRKRERFGPHPSQLPGWKPLWKRQREAAAAAK